MSEIQQDKFTPVKVNSAWCKGCGICVSFCPRKVFKLINGKSVVVHPEECIRCGICQLRCPDFAIDLEEIEDEKY